MTHTQRPTPIFLRMFSLLAALLLAVLAAGPAFADSGDLDEIESYVLSVNPNEDGSLSIQADVHWKVLDSTSEGPLEWVQIGLPNQEATDFTPLTSTIRSVRRDGNYARIDFDRSYEAGEVVEFSYRWTQKYMYTLADNGALSYEYTPGWFDSANVDQLVVNWYAGSLPSATASSPSASLDVLTDAGGQTTCYQFSQSGLAHGERVTVSVQYDSWPQALSSDNSAEAYTGSGSDASGDDTGVLESLFYFFMFFLFISFFVAVQIHTSWHGGLADDGRRYVYYHGLYYPCAPHGGPMPGSVGKATAPSGFHGMGGGGSFGGGAGRGGGGCACASSCACACACAGGGRAGCSAKNLYGAVRLPKSFDHAAPHKAKR